MFESGSILCHIAGAVWARWRGLLRKPALPVPGRATGKPSFPSAPADTRDPEHSLLPQDPCQRADVLSWLFFQTSTLVPIAQSVAVPLVLGSPSLKSQVAKGVEDLKRFLVRACLPAHVRLQAGGGAACEGGHGAGRCQAGALGRRGGNKPASCHFRPPLLPKEIMDKRLGEAGGWLAAGRFTVADIAHCGMVLLLKYILGAC